MRLIHTSIFALFGDFDQIEALFCFGCYHSRLQRTWDGTTNLHRPNWKSSPLGSTENVINLEVPAHPPRGVTRLDGARGKKLVWRPQVRTWGLSEANYCIEESACNIVGLLCAPRSHSALPAVIWLPGNCVNLAPLRYAPAPTSSVFSQTHQEQVVCRVIYWEV